MTILARLFFLLCFGHALADQPLQNEWLTRAKRGLIEGCPVWFGLFMHSLIHAGFVLLFTGSLTLGIAELLCHASIDAAKNAECFGMRTDQVLHIGCKIVWVMLWPFI